MNPSFSAFSASRSSRQHISLCCQCSLFRPGAFPQNIFFQLCPSILIAVSLTASPPVNLSRDPDGRARSAQSIYPHGLMGKTNNFYLSNAVIFKQFKTLAKQTNFKIRTKHCFLVEYFPKIESIASVSVSVIYILIYAFIFFPRYFWTLQAPFPLDQTNLNSGTRVVLQADWSD